MNSKRNSTLTRDPTVSIIRVGSNSKYAEGWDKAFGGGKKKATAKKKSASKPAKKSKKKKKKS